MQDAKSPRNSNEEHSTLPLSPPVTVFLGWFAFAVVSGVALLFVEPGSSGLPAAQRLLLHVYDLGHALALGGAIAVSVWIWNRWKGSPRYLGWAIAAIASIGVGLSALAEDLAGPASRMSGGSESRLPLLALIALVSLGVPVVAFVATRLGRGPWRLLPLLGALVVAVGNYQVLRGDYPGAHLLFGVCAGCAAAGALHGVRWRAPRWVLWAILLLGGAIGLGTAMIPPPNSIALALHHTWGVSSSPFLPRTWLNRDPEGAAPPPMHAADHKPIAPSGLLPVAPDSIILYYSVDSLRADLLTDAYAARFPEFHRLREESVWFTRARAPGSQTVYTLTSVMAGTYFSQQFWSSRWVAEGKGSRGLWPHEDPTVRFPTILADAGIPTVQYGQAVWLLNEYGMTRGFSEEKIIAPVPGRPSTKGKWSTGEDIMRAIEARLRRHDEGPLFLFFHDLDPHSPFDLGSVKKGSGREKYLSEIKLVDERIGQLRRSLEELGLTERTILIFSSDHGEGFGEHGTSFHGGNLYDEQLDVPLLILHPQAPPREVDEPVTLMDLGPTILDLMGLSTPAYFMGQSLVPYLAGKTPTLTRPIIAEGRLKQAMVLPNGLKLIRNKREKTFEIYDLNKDPKELDNLYDKMGDQGSLAMQELVQFFETYQIRKKGYTIPYRR
jgi:hypothetical protein